MTLGTRYAIDKVRRRVRPAHGRAPPLWLLPTVRRLFILMSALAVFTAVADVPVPKVPKGKGAQCVEETDFMRKNHMDLLVHQRDETVHRGIRTKKHSLKECINCHAVNNAANQAVDFQNPRHFCTSCHVYAAVTIDCFECHASKPGPAPQGIAP